MRLLSTRQFRRDVNRARRRGKPIDKLWDLVDLLLSDKPLPQRSRPHRLAGEWSHCWECHIEPDWLLMWTPEEDALVLVRTGTHSDLFE